MAEAEAAGNPSLFMRGVNAFLEYETPKVVHISNKTVGFINRCIQLAIVLYIAIYVIWYQRGYQDIDTATSASTTKLKGVSMTNYSQLNISIHGGVNGIRIWDVADYVVPPQENDAFFVTTNVVITPNQTQGRCPEDPTVWKAKCKQDSDCPFGVPLATGNGVRTGKCVQSDQNKSVKTCEIFAWCPVEVDKLPISGQSMLSDSQNFTVLIKNYVEFPKFKTKRRNILDGQNGTYLKTCTYNKDSSVDKYCPIFSLRTIMEGAQVYNYNDISVSGGVIVINIDWDCNLDRNIEDCLPRYSFSRLDEVDAKIAKGSNFRYAAMYEKDGTLYRDLFKAYGIRFILKVTGTAGKFNIVPLLLNIGSGVGLLAVASIVCDILVLYVLKKRHVYKTKKYLFVDGEVDGQGHMCDDDDEDCVRHRKRAASAPAETVARLRHDEDDTPLLES